MRGFAQIKALKLACLAEWRERESWAYLLLFPPTPLLLPCTSFTYVQVSEKERGPAVVARNRPALVSIKRSVPYCFGAHRLVCLLIMSEYCTSDECGKVLGGQWLPSPSTPSPCLCNWTTLNCLEAIQDKGPVLPGCEGPVCDLYGTSGASARRSNVCLTSSVFVMVAVG